MLNVRDDEVGQAGSAVAITGCLRAASSQTLTTAHRLHNLCSGGLSLPVPLFHQEIKFTCYL